MRHPLIQSNSFVERHRAALLFGCTLACLAAPIQAQTLGTVTSSDKISSSSPSPEQEAQLPSDISTGADIVVTGLRAGIERSLKEKRNSVAVVDVISAEDIGKFPDNNLAESLQRVPGITIDRSVNGEGQSINLRGLGSGFTRSEINGGTALNGFDFSVLAPELFSKITVEKSPTASTVEGGLAGTIKQETPKPFDIKGFRATLIGGATIGQVASTAPRVFGLISKNWNDAFGITVAAAYSETDFLTNEVDYGPWALFRDIASAEALATAPADLLNAATPRTTAYYSYRQKRDNIGVTAAVQARPSDKLELTADFIFAQKNGVQIDDRPDAPIEGTTFFSDGTTLAGNQVPTNYTISNGAVTSATFNNIQNRVGYTYSPQKNSILQGSLRATWQPTEHLTIKPGFSYAHNQTSSAFNLFSFAQNGGNLSYSVDGDVPKFSSTTTDFATNPERYGFNVFIFSRGEDRFDEYVARLDFSRSFDGPVGGSIDWGVRYTNNKETLSTNSAYLYQGNSLLGATPPTLGDVATTLPFRVRGANTPRRILSANIDRVRSVFYQSADPFTSDAFARDPVQDQLQSYESKERTFAGYLQGNMNVGAFSANAGLRVVSTNTRAVGIQIAGTEVKPVDNSGHYVNFLPALNAKYELQPNMLVRATYSRAITRPGLGDLSPAEVVSPGNRTGTRGNPDLLPYSADQQDLAYEWYFHRGSLLTIGGFAKEIDSLISQTIVNELTTFPDQETGLPTTAIVSFSQPTNAGGATVKGVEAGLQSPFYFLPGGLSRFGAIFNYTFATSKAASRAADGSTRTTPLPGLSKHSANAVLYYDFGGIDSRLAYAWRSTYLRSDGVGSQFGAERYIRGYGQLDYSLNLSINRRFQIGVDINNVLDTQRKEYILVNSGAHLPASLLEQERRFVLTGRVVF